MSGDEVWKETVVATHPTSLRPQHLAQLLQRPGLPRPPIQQPRREQQVHQPELDGGEAPTDVPRLHPAVPPHQHSDRAARDGLSVVARRSGERAVHHGLDLLSDRRVWRRWGQCGLPASDLVLEEFRLDGAGHERDHFHVEGRELYS